MRRLTLDHTETSRLVKMLQKFWTGINEVRPVFVPSHITLLPHHDENFEKHPLWYLFAEPNKSIL